MCLENKKGPEEAPCTPPDFGWPLAIPGGAPGYDDDKQFGNIITHRTAQASQRLREHTAQAPKVKSQAEITLNFEFSGVPGVRRGRILGVQPCERRSPGVAAPLRTESGSPRHFALTDAAPAMTPRSGSFLAIPRRLRLHPCKFRQLVPEPGELPLGVVAGVGAADLGGFLQPDLAFQMPISAGTPWAFIAGSSGSSFAPPAARPLPARPLSASHRSVHRSAHRARRDPAQKQRAEQPGGSSGGRPSRCQSESERPVASTTSRARAMRVRSRGFRRAAAAGSRRASSACNASTPSRSSRARTASRTRPGSAAPPTGRASAP